MVESALVLFVFIVGLMGTVDIAQMMFVHQSLTERVRQSLRWGVVRPYDGTGDQLANMILYNKSVSPGIDTGGYLNMTRANIAVQYEPGTFANPNNERLTVSIVNLNFTFFSPMLSSTFRNNYAMTQSAPMMYKP